MNSNKIEKLKQLSELYKEGILTKEEVEQEKKKILAEDESQIESNSATGPYKTSSSYDNGYDEDETKSARKKKLIYCGIALIILIGIGVFIGLYQHHHNRITLEKEREQARLDSIAEVERQIAQQREDSIRHDAEIREFTSPDLALYGLHGKVKSLKIIKGLNYYPYPFSAKKIEFTEEGDLKSNKPIKDYAINYIGMLPEYKININKNADGYVANVKSSEEGSMTLYWQNGLLKSFKWDFYEFENEATYSYNDNILTEYRIQDSSMTGSNYTSITYNNYEYDRFDNWIKCSYTMTGSYEEVEPGVDYDEDYVPSVTKIGPKTGSIELEIEYYE